MAVLRKALQRGDLTLEKVGKCWHVDWWTMKYKQRLEWKEQDPCGVHLA